MIKLLRQLTTLLAFLLLFSSAFGQTDKERIDAYVSQYGELAIKEMIRTGVPAAITLAQGIHETAGGQSDLASLAHNHFGIKCKGEWTGETMSHDDDAKGECFRKYATVEESYRDHSDFLKNRPIYAFLFKLDPTDYEGWAKGLKKAGYATNPAYSQKLIKLIVENNLQQFTLEGLQREQEVNNNVFALNTSPKKETEAGTTAGLSEKSFISSTPTYVENKTVSKQQTYPVNAVFNINDTRVVYAANGTSLLALANNYSVSLKKLLEFNELPETDILPAGQLIYLARKSKHGAKDFHVVEANETLHDIAQKEGVQLASLLEYNRLQKNMQPAIGEKIYLKAEAPNTPRLAVANYNRSGTNM